MGEGVGGGPFRVKNHVMSLRSPVNTAKARRLQLADASFRDNANQPEKNMMFLPNSSSDCGKKTGFPQRLRFHLSVLLGNIPTNE